MIIQSTENFKDACEHAISEIENGNLKSAKSFLQCLADKCRWEINTNKRLEEHAREEANREHGENYFPFVTWYQKHMEIVLTYDFAKHSMGFHENYYDFRDFVYHQPESEKGIVGGLIYHGPEYGWSSHT